MSENVALVDGKSDFDFLFGNWSVANRRLRRPLSGSNDWYEFKATALESPFFSGEGNLEQYDAPNAPGLGPVMRPVISVGVA